MKVYFLLITSLLCSMSLSAERKEEHKPYPHTMLEPVSDILHGKQIVDNFRWLEDGNNFKVKAWGAEQSRFTEDYLSQYDTKALEERIEKLSRYDDMKYGRALHGTRRFVYTKKADDERWVLSYQENANSPLIELINPNLWRNETLEFASPSRDGQYLAFAKASGGNERPIIHVMEVNTKKILSDSVKGSKQGWPGHHVSWDENNQGFYYSANPEESEGRECEYWNSVYYHRLGTQKSEDKKIFFDEGCKEIFHDGSVSEDGKWLFLTKSKMFTSEIYLQRLDIPNAPIISLATGFDALYGCLIADNTLLIMTNAGAPNYKVYVTDVDHPEKEHWKEWLPEKSDRLTNIDAIGGKIYVEYLHNASTEIKVYTLQGEYLNDVPLPAIGTASVSGYWSKPEVRLGFTSFTVPRASYFYIPETKELQFEQAPKLAFDPSQFSLEQVWYPSKDGTQVSMFLLVPKDRQNKQIPFYLTGYGGFDTSITPSFSDTAVAILEAGGGVAIPNLRGGGEYGRSWHEAGCRENKQNVFDDFITAATWLIEKGYTSSDRLAIRGGSNGGLLVGAALTQRPDLFAAVLCEVPLLDMIRYHQFGFANIWESEYGTAENSDQFAYLLKYSPYHNLKENVRYPSTLIIAGENDARVDPLHARKMIAELQRIDPNGKPHLLLVESQAGHTGATTVSAKIQQKVLRLGFMMSQIGLLK